MDQVMKALEEGDESISNIISESVKYLGIAIANIDNFVQPKRILLDAMIFTNEKNRELFLETVFKNSISPVPETERFIFIDHTNMINGARGAAAVAIRTDLETYIE
jgi:predicted NBD/HSP70 family sugar kinase